MSAIIFVNMSDVKMCLDSVGICFDVTFRVTCINGIYVPMGLLWQR